MTRKDFETIAEGINNARRTPSASFSASEVASMNRALDMAATNLAVRLGQTNPRFDTQRFLAACGVPA